MSAPIVTTGPANGADQRGFFGHPKGLQTLFFTEMWERFSYYGMRAFLVFYASASVTIGGLGMTTVEAGAIYAMYGASVYMVSLPGGWIADRFLGQRKAVLFGGILIMFGHITLAIPSPWSFYAGLALIVVGTGLLKPNISTIVGQLYSREDPRRDSGYTIYYMGINIGAFLAPLVCGWLASKEDSAFRGVLAGWGMDPNHSWHFGFGAAAVGMFFGLVQYVLGWRHLGEAGLRPTVPAEPSRAARDRKILVAVLLAIFGLPVLVGTLSSLAVIHPDKESVNAAFGVGLLLVSIALFIGMLVMAADGGERRRVVAMLVLFIGCQSFFGVFEQAGSTLNNFADQHVVTELFGFDFPAEWFQSVNAVFVIALAPIFAWIWIRLARVGREPTSVTKFSIGMVLNAVSFLIMLPTVEMVNAGHRVSPVWLLGLYFFATAAEMCVSPVGLSSMSKLAPTRLAGMVMGAWFLATANGYWIAGNAERLTHDFGLSTLFLATAGASLVAGGLLYALSGPIKRMLNKEPELPKAIARERE